MPRPFYALAPMANVTDSVFRKLFATYGKPDVTWTEFVSADGLCSAGKERLMPDLAYSPKERPVVAQLFTGHPDAMEKAAALVAKLGFDGIDINMGCPDRAVEKQGGGAANIKDPKNALAVLQAARKGAAGIPVSVKTRIGYNKIDMGWLELLLKQHLPALTVHLRTRKEMSDVPAHWELMPEIVRMRDEIQANTPQNERTLIIGNGDVTSIEDARAKADASGCDGVMIGRGIFGKPWFFAEMRGTQGGRTPEKLPRERLEILLEHARAFDRTFRDIKSFAVMKKHFKAYVNGWDGARELRAALMETDSYKETKKVIETYLKTMDMR